MVISVKRKLTNDYGLLREKMLKSEALLTLSLKASFEANSAPTLHGKNKNATAPGVGALFANALRIQQQRTEWHLSRPNCSLYRTRWLMTSLSRFVVEQSCPFTWHHLARQ